MCVYPAITSGKVIVLDNASQLNGVAGGTGGANETSANTDAHQLPVIQLETSNCAPAE